jgi:2-oxoglutarate ferredoxin oxidoreductase subunit gamma
MEAQFLIAGFGGQGILLIGQLMAKAAMHEGKNVSWMPSYGPEMRGGEANCAVVISDEPIGSPLVTEPPVAVIMNLPSLTKFEPAMETGGLLLYNTSLIDVKPQRKDIKVLPIPCNDIAESLGNGRVANMVMLGAIIAATNAITLDSAMDALKGVFGEKKANLLPLNRKAMEAGMDAARKAM